MSIRYKTLNRAKSFLEAIKIENIIVSNSTRINNQTKAAFLKQNIHSKNFIEHGINSNKLTISEIRSLENEFFTYWNEAINLDVEIFWTKSFKHDLPYQRKSPINQLLNKNKFLHTDQWIELFNNSNELQQNGFLKNQELYQIQELLKQEEEKRFNLIKRCFHRKKIPHSKYLKFGEALAFLNNCNLISKYFTEKEIEEIYQIWKKA